MQIIKSLAKLLFFVSPFFATAQSTNLNQGAKEYHFVDRLEILYQKNTDINFSTIKPYSRKKMVQEIELIDSVRRSSDSIAGEASKNKHNIYFSKADKYNLSSLLMGNSEWVTGSKESFKSRKPILKTFYKTQPNLLEVNTKDFFLVVNPVLQFNGGKQTDYDETLFINSRGLTLRGRIANKIGFSSTIIDNQERGPQYFQDLYNPAKVNYPFVPGVGFYKTFKNTGVDYFDARGYFTFNVAKYIDIQFGYDKNFIGDGYRSLFLSDFGNSYLFLKLNTQIWKFNYQNLFMELMPQELKTGDNLLPRKYAAMHHLSMNVTKWLNLGLFEGVVFGREDHFDFEYLNPIIFYRHIEGTVGSPDNALAGFDFKANLLHRVQLYGQFLLDEFKLSEIKAGNGWWANKWGLQGGLKYINVAGLKNLDLQLEANVVRPFTYSHYDHVANYTHYNQPLAHPLGANFYEFITVVRYQPLPKLYITAKAIFYNKGLDTLNKESNGGDIFRSNKLTPDGPRVKEYGFEIAGGRKATCLNGILNVSYELKQNLFFDLSYQYRKYDIQNEPANSSNTSMISAGVRINMFKREYDY